MGRWWPKPKERILPRTLVTASQTLVLLQCGGVPRRGTDLASVCVRATFDSRGQRHVSGGGLFVDITTAFYAVIRQLAVPCSESDDAIAWLFMRLGLEPSVIQDLAEAMAQPDSLEVAGVPDLTRHIIALSFEATYLSSKEPRNLVLLIAAPDRAIHLRILFLVSLLVAWHLNLGMICKMQGSFRSCHSVNICRPFAPHPPPRCLRR